MTTAKEEFEPQGRHVPDEVFNAIFGSLLLVSYVTACLLLVAVVAACGPSPVRISSEPQALELTGVPTEEIRLALTNADEQIYEARGELYARLHSEELEFDTTLPVGLQLVGTEALGRFIVPGIPGQPIAQLTGTLWGTLDLGSAGKRQVEVPITLAVGPSGTTTTSGHSDGPSEVAVLSVVLGVCTGLLFFCIALWNLHPAFEETRRWSQLWPEAFEKGITASELLAYVRSLEPKGAPATSDADAVNARGE